jgi:hypothetical protein
MDVLRTRITSARSETTFGGQKFAQKYGLSYFMRLLPWDSATSQVLNQVRAPDVMLSCRFLWED